MEVLLDFPLGRPALFPTARVQRGESATARCASKGSNHAAPPSERTVPGGAGAKGSATPLLICSIDSVGGVKRVCGG
jgi:hypothetical protein